MRLLVVLLICLALSAQAKTPDTVAYLPRGSAVFTPSCTASVPAPASAAGYNTLTFCDNLTSNAKVDVNNTGNTSLYHLFPINNFGGFGPFLIPSTYYSNDGTSMLVNGQPGGGPNVIYGTITSAISGSTVTGGMFAGGLYTEIDMKFDRTLDTPSPLSDPAYFSFPPSVWCCSNPATYDYVEVDVMECGPNGANCIWQLAIHEWTSHGNTCNSVDDITGPPDNNWHTYSFRWIPPVGAGLGTLNWYIDGTLEKTIQYSATTVPTGTSCPSGTFSVLDSNDFGGRAGMTFIVNTGKTQPLNVRNWHVFQAP